jgi:seryl-tRNA synthetase
VIDIKQLRQDADGVRAALARRRDSALNASIDRLMALDRRRRDALTRTETLKAQEGQGVRG